MGTLMRRRDGAVALLAAEHVVGRLPSCALPLDACFVSSAHALIRWNGEAWELRDLGSTNGTYADGHRIVIGASVRLRAGVEVVFGDAGETWQVVDDRSPTAMVIPLSGGEPICCASGTIPIPTPDEPLATVYSEGDRWILETDDSTKVVLRSGQHFWVAGRAWRFEATQDAVATRSSRAHLKHLADVTITFEVSSDEEHVGVKLGNGDGDGCDDQDIGRRACFYLALVLFRTRVEEHDAGIADPGWVDLESLSKMVPEYGSGSHLNVEIFRLRRALYDAGISNAAAIIERRRGAVRFGSDRAQILGRDSHPGRTR